MTIYRSPDDWEGPGDPERDPAYRVDPTRRENWRVPLADPMLSEAIAYLNASWRGDAVDCPCCTQRVKLEKHDIKQMDVEVASRIWRAYGMIPFQSTSAVYQVTRYDEKYRKPPRLCVALMAQVKILRRLTSDEADAAVDNHGEFYAGFWENEKDESAHLRQARNSWYEFTEDGVRWLHCLKAMPSRAWKFDRELVQVDPEPSLVLTACEINGSFNLDETMSATWWGSHYPQRASTEFEAGLTPDEDGTE